jgi:hypothetical protein
MTCELYPLDWKKFEEYHRNAWNVGSTFGPAFIELYLDYLENWKFFKDYLEDLIESVQPGNNYAIKILIGEAPPIWKGINDPKERSYYYNPKHSKSTPWLYEPLKYFINLVRPKDWEIKDGKLYLNNKLASKPEKLKFLARNGVILIDIFPFPVLQHTNVRKKTSKNNIRTSFSVHIENYFIKHLQEVLAYLKCNLKNMEDLKIEYAFMAPEFTSLQLMYDPNIVDQLLNLNLTPFVVKNAGTSINVQKISEIVFETGLAEGVLPNSKPKSNPKSNFLFKLTKCEKIETTKLENIPILINGQSPTFKDFFNSSEEKLKEKFGIKTK